jgi:hypothetical protein
MAMQMLLVGVLVWRMPRVTTHHCLVCAALLLAKLGSLVSLMATVSSSSSSSKPTVYVCVGSAWLVLVDV